MLSVKSLGAADSGLAQYYEDLASEDYYQNGGEPPGTWLGSLCDDLNLHGNVKHGQLRHLFQGMHPGSEEPLARNAGQSHKAGWDLTFSAPKSVSLVWAIAEGELHQQLTAAHTRAIERALAYLEAKAFRSRDRLDPEAGRGALVAAVFQHSTSRALDPQLHSHVVVGNLGRRLDGSWCALDFDSRWKMAAGALYRAELASELQHLGYGIERDGSSFRLAGIPEPVTQAFSTRRNQIVEALKQSGHTSAKAAGVAALATRVAKADIDQKILRPLWREQAQAIGLDDAALGALRTATQHLHGDAMQDTQPQAGAAAATPIDLDAIIERLTLGSSTFTRMQFEAAVITQAQGLLGARQIERLMDSSLQDRQKDTGPLGLLRLRHLADGNSSTSNGSDQRRRDVPIYTSREMLAIEQSILQAAIQRSHDGLHCVSALPGLASAPFLSIEQTQALHHLTESSGAVQVLRGLAGTGKSTLLAAAKVAWEAQGMQVLGAALAGKAADSLQLGSNIPCQTLHSLIHGLTMGEQSLAAHSVLVIDEAAMVGSRQLKQILDLVHAAGAKVVLVGDAQQLQPIEAGGMFRCLADALGASDLQEIRRQVNVEDRQFIHRLVKGQIQDTLEDLDARHLLSSCPARSVHQVMVHDWSTHFEPDQPDKNLMLAGTRSDAHQLNLLARLALQEKGLLGAEMPVATETGPREMAIGERIMFTRNNRPLGVRNGQTGTLVGCELSLAGIPQLTIRTDANKMINVDTAAYGHLDYGYAVTLHKAQGQTVDHVWVLLSESMADREWTYVAASRHRQTLKVFAAEESIDEIRSLMQVSREKRSSLDYVVVATESDIADKSMQDDLELG